MATTQILPFCTDAAGSGGNRLSPTAYAALTTLLATGFQSGTANSTQANTALAQATFMAAGLAQFCVAQGVSVPDDGNLTNLVTEIETAISTYVSGIFPAVNGASKNLKGVWASNTTATWTADALVTQTGGGIPHLLTAYNQTLNTATSGAGGLDTGSLASSTWYHVFAIYNPTTPATSILMSLSATAPTLPSGYTYSAKIGTVYSDSSSHLRGFIQIKDKTQFVVGSNLSSPVVVYAGTTSSDSWTAVTVSGVMIPATATKISLSLMNIDGAGYCAAAPNSSYSVTSNAPMRCDASTGASGGAGNTNQIGEFVLETTTVQYEANSLTSSSNANLFCLGYTDAI